MQSMMFLVVFILLFILLPKQSRFKYDFYESKPWAYNDLVAPFDFPIEKSEAEIQAEETEILRSTMPYFYVDKTTEDSVFSRFAVELETQLGEKNYSEAQEKQILAQGEKFAKIILDSIYTRGILLLKDYPKEMQKEEALIQLLGDNSLEIKRMQDFYTLEKLSEEISQYLQNIPYYIDKEEIELLLLRVIEPNIIFDKKKTIAEQKSRLESISSFKGMVQKNEIIVSKGEIIDAEKLQVLRSLKKEFEEGKDNNIFGYGLQVGQALILLITLLFFALYLFFFHKKQFVSVKSCFIILLWHVAMLGLCIALLNFETVFSFLIPFGLMAIVIRSFYNERLAFISVFFTVLLAGIIIPNYLDFFLLHLLATIVALLSLRRMDKRSQFFISSVYVFVTYALLYLAVLLIQKEQVGDNYYFALMIFGGNAILTMLAIPFIYLFERSLGLITDISLLELSNANNPLLKEYAAKAPGSFQHSMQLASIAEEAVYRIGGNSLLVRTAALYHDIGKMHTPHYFTENQNFGLNPHDELSYEESAKIIIDHVNKGIEIAHKHKLPNPIIDFIKTHHGTKKAEYFYIMAKKEAKKEEDVDASLYAYPGPIPSSKEMAVLMMVDAVEAASRSLEASDKEHISALVENIIDAQMHAGQFNNADITLKEISKVKRIIKQKLINLYHVRIAYPKEK